MSEKAPSKTPETEAEIASRPAVTAALARGVSGLLRDLGFSTLLETPLANGRRADIMAVGKKGEIWIVETKSCLADFVTDSKWPHYQPYCDAFFFGVGLDFPQASLPHEAGLIVADQFGGAIVRPAPSHPLSAPRRKALLLGYGRLAAQRLSRHEAVPTPPRDSAYEEPI